MNHHSSSKMQIGIKQVKRVLAADNAAQILVAQDADGHIIQEIVQKAEEQSVPILYIPTMKALGEMCEIDVGAAAAVIIKKPQ